MDLEIRNRAAIVTGGSKGMGKAIALKLATEGARICLVAREEEALRKAVSDVSEISTEEVLFVAGDVSNPALANEVVDKVASAWGQTDILINNAGGPPMGSFLDHDDQAWLAALQLNLLSTVRFTTAVAPGMKQQQWGRIVNITSSLAKEPSAPMVLSATARAGVSAFSKSISHELAEDNVTINTILPGGVKTDRLLSLMKVRAETDGIPLDELVLQRAANLPIKRFAEPEEIADVVAFLTSERGGYVTGTSIAVDGGLTKATF
jgi:3-oxoacyl-[acyl-carrier protein] reductase